MRRRYSLFSEQTVQQWALKVPALEVRTVPDVNHFTITLSEQGAKVLADTVCDLLKGW